MVKRYIEWQKLSLSSIMLRWTNMASSHISVMKQTMNTFSVTPAHTINIMAALLLMQSTGNHQAR